MISYKLVDSRGLIMAQGNAQSVDHVFVPAGFTLVECDPDDALPRESVRYSGGEWVPIAPQPTPFSVFDPTTASWVDPDDLTEARAAAAARINSAAGLARSKFVTEIPAQQMIYLAKESEARRYLAEPVEPVDLSSFPLISAEIGITGETAYQIATIWVFMAENWTQIAASIEAARLTGVNAVATAASLTQIDAAVSIALSSFEQIST